MVQQDYRFLKAIVAGMGIVLMIGLAVIVATLLKRSGAKPVAHSGAVTLPAGARLLETTLGEGSIVLHVQDEGGDTLVILDARTGVETGRVRLVVPDAADH